jgi:hypothetical protein
MYDNSIFTLADIAGPGAIQHIWMTTFPGNWRRLILRSYWDKEAAPSIECPYGDFFANGWCEHCNVNSQPIAGETVFSLAVGDGRFGRLYP